MLNKLRNLDLPIIFILLLFTLFSTLVIHSGVRSTTYSNYDIRNLINYALGFVVLLSVCMLNYRFLLKASPYLYGAGLISLVAVYLFGAVKNGARGWFTIPGIHFDFQPAELVKLLIILLLGFYMGNRQGEPLKIFRDLIPICVFVAVPFLLVLIQPDLGNAVIYLVILLGMIWIGNIKYLHAIAGIAVVAGSLVLFLYLFQTYHQEIQTYLNGKGFGHWVDRIDTFIYPEKASFDEAYQVNNSIRAIGSGMLTGEGFMKGSSVQKGFIPFAYSDSIFVVIGEEFGFVGSSALLLLYFLLIYRLVLIAINCTDRAGAFILIGIISMFVFQIFENIGMLIGLMPLTGITLPFISYGGTSLLINMMCIGVALSIKMHQEKPTSY